MMAFLCKGTNDYVLSTQIMAFLCKGTCDISSVMVT